MNHAHPQETYESADMLLELEVMSALKEVCDPEIPSLSVTDLGMVSEVQCRNGHAHVKMTPTFVGCPALAIIQHNVEDAVSRVSGVTSVQVEFVFNQAWTTDRITEEGKTKLKAFGIAPPKCSLRSMQRLHADCPYCGSTDTRLENMFGPTACRSVYYCNTCKQPFESMKPV